MKSEAKFLFRVLYLLIALQVSRTESYAQYECYFEHYGAEDGLPQHTVMDILQDKKGFMWFTTWDGLCKFDGYKFITYRLSPSTNPEAKSNRLDYIYEDKYNTIWILSYDKQAYRFNPQTEVFTGVHSLEYYKDKEFYTSQIIMAKSGKIWLLSDDSGCICVTDSTFKAEIFNTRNQNLTDDFVTTIYEDKKRNSWILTGKGLTFLSPNHDQKLFYFHPKSDTPYKKCEPFFDALEFEDEIWFASSNGRIWRYDKDNGVFSVLKTQATSDIITLKKISSEKIFIVSENSGFLIYNTFDGSIDKYDTQTLPGMKSDKILNTFIDKSKNIWMETDQLGVAKFNPYTKKYIHFTPSIESTESNVFPPNFFIFEDKENRLWVHPRGGGFSLYDKTEDKLQPFYNEPFAPNWMFSNMLHSAYADRQGNLWLATRSCGLEKVIFYDSKFKTIHVNSNIHSAVNNDVRPIFQDSEKNIWIATKDEKIHIYDQNMQKKGILTEDGIIGEGPSLAGSAYCIMEDSKKNIWIGTKGKGVYKLIRKKNPNTFEIHPIQHNPHNPFSLSNDNIYSIFEDKNGNIWIGTYGGGLNLIRGGNEKSGIINGNNNLKNYPLKQGAQVRILSADKHGNIYVGTTFGLIVFDENFTKPEEIVFRVYLRKDRANSIGGNDIFDICTTKSGDTYIGTFGGGISKIEETDQNGFPLTFKSFGTSNGLPSNIILSLMEDNDGNLWIATEEKLTKFNPQKETFENFSEIKRLMKKQSFSENSRCRIHNGSMLFGFSHGIVIFDPKDIAHPTFNPYLALVQLKIFNQRIPISTKGPLKKNINYLEKLELKHDQNFFSIEFAALDYVDPENILYAYKLDGFDKEWIYTGNNRIANYTNLSKGKYTFRVKSTNSEGVWMNNERTLAIEVLPPFWDTSWAHFIYVLLSLTLIYFVFKILHTFYEMRNKIILEQKESEIKTTFFTNISHEIRTPLTMIVSPIENMLQRNDTPEPIKKQLTIVTKNTNRLLNMVNQILDFQKIQQTSSLTVTKIEIVPFVENIFNTFSKNAEIQHIEYTFVNKAEGAILWADPEAVEKILVNLLSNAFKYTPMGKSIRLSVFEQNDKLAIQVADTGLGINKEKQSRLFKRFESFNEDKSKPSTGIGLSIVKDLADKHHADIQVESETGKGTTFTVLFKKGILHYDSDVLIKDSTETKQENKPSFINEVLNKNISLNEKTNEKTCILIVEDDEDLRQFIKSLLEIDYEVHEASNGKEGMKKALELIPDFIISDIMMPEMDGIKFLENVRKNIQTSHILFLLLTAKTTIDSKLEGFEHGADEYITKPFSVSYFQTRIKNLLKRRNELQQYYRNKGYSEPDKETIETSSLHNFINQQDADFLKSVDDFIQNHLGENDFVVEDLAREMGMSRTVFFKKIKGLTGLSPIEYIHEAMMQKAACLLKTGEFTVKEISFMLGISDTKYFTKCFKKKYSVTPGEYKKKHINRTINKV
ncbi:hybrid sensor histidine kinase/response regulator transcription factor [Anaerorudis cellulosivorans]|uniref:hybrid sensor histidine kinase/response regulator transcription factor n=1 Tax=Anaerorudis cellulosivorans TaxID=3397862 RepID=UPI00221FF942|nr:two-component regulator propeller domain-containing protein [Seramator thermalis]MCW1736098.1 response regulator [Seramator thermalis]